MVQLKHGVLLVQSGVLDMRAADTSSARAL